jgi:hypothetical protein
VRREPLGNADAEPGWPEHVGRSPLYRAARCAALPENMGHSRKLFQRRCSAKCELGRFLESILTSAEHGGGLCPTPRGVRLDLQPWNTSASARRLGWSIRASLALLLVAHMWSHPPVPRVLTASQATNNAEEAIAHGTRIVGGVSSNKGGTTHLGLPVFDNISQVRVDSSVL